jgi:hypothetical protein
MAFAEGDTPGGCTYRDLFVHVFGGEPEYMLKPANEKSYSWPYDIDKTDIAIIFEIASPDIRKPYDGIALFFLAMRNRVTGEYINNFDFFRNLVLRSVTVHLPFYPFQYRFKSFDDCIESSKQLPPMDEGDVTKDKNGWRIKIKNPAYFAIANLRMNGVISEKRIIKLVIMGDHEEYLNYFPEDGKYFEPYIKAYHTMILIVNALWKQHKDIEDQKEFAMAIKACHVKGVLFAMRNKKQQLGEILDNMTDNGKERLLKKYVEK